MRFLWTRYYISMVTQQQITASYPDLAITPEDGGFAIGDTWCPTYAGASRYQRADYATRERAARVHYDIHN